VGNFNIPSGKSAMFVTESSVTINPGFQMTGSNLEIDVGSTYYDSYPLAKAGSKQNQFDRGSSLASSEPEFTVVRSTQGFTARLWLQSPSDVQGYLMTVDGKIASRVSQGTPLDAGYHEFQLNVPQGGGLYFAYFRVGSQTYKQLLPRL
jgi:hypothetical protein